MAPRSRYLVTSAAGKTGFETAVQLLERGESVQAFVRRRHARSVQLERAGAEIFIGNQYDIDDLRRAMQGIQRAYHCAPTAPNGLLFGAAFAAAAFEAKLEHVVVLGQWLSSTAHPSLFTRESWLNEALMAHLPGTTTTFVRPGWFAENYFMVLEPAAQLGILPMPLGSGDEALDAPPSARDIAAVNVAALLDPATHAGQTYRPTGPELLTPRQIADQIAQALGRPVRYMRISERMFLKALAAMRPLNYSEPLVAQLQIYTEEYRRGTFAISAPTNAVEHVAGRPPERFEAMAKRLTRQAVGTGLIRKLVALKNFAKIAVTAAPNTARVQRVRDYVLLTTPKYAQDAEEWQRFAASIAGAGGRPAVPKVVSG